MVRRTPALAALVTSDLGARARAVTGTVRHDVLTRASAFLLLNDSRASFRIE